MNREQLIALGTGLAAIGVANVVPVVGTMVLAPLAAVAVGGYFGYRRAHRDGATLGQATLTSGLAGLGGLIGTMIVLTAMVFVVSLDPSLQAYARASEPHPEARIPFEMIPLLGAATGAVVGLAAGTFNLAVTMAAGFVGGLIGGVNPDSGIRQIAG